MSLSRSLSRGLTRAIAGSQLSNSSPNVSIMSIVGSGTEFTITFSGPVIIDTNEVPDSGLSFEGAAVSGFAGNSGAVVSIVTDAGLYTAGIGWTLNSQPGWLLTPIVGTQSGTTT